MAAILTNGVLKTRSAPIFQPLLAAGALQGLWEHKGPRCPPANAAHSPPRRSPAPARARHAAPDGQAHSQPTDPSQQSPQSSVSGREPTPTARPVTRLALPTSPPHRRTPKLLATRPSFVTRYRPPAPTHCTHHSPINRRNNRLKFFPLAPTGSPPSPSISSTSPHCSSVSRGTGTNGPTGNNRIRAGLIPHPSASHGAAQHAAPQSAHLPSSADHADASQPQSPEFSLQPHFSLQE